MTISRNPALLRLADARRRGAWLLCLRPQSLASPLIKLFGAYERRMIVEVEGLSLYLDPFSHLAGAILAEGTYEPQIVDLFRAEIRPGDTVLDIGANEGFFSALAARLAGPGATVVAVEPQQRLHDVLRINLALNRAGTAHVVHAAIGAPSGDADGGGERRVELSLAPLSNSGASSLRSRYRWGGGTESVPLRTVGEVLDSLDIDRVDFVKVDVEGYETEVIPSLIPLLAAGRIRSVLIDYHAALLHRAGIDALPLHNAILAAGYDVAGRESETLDGYRLYRRANAGRPVPACVSV